MSGDLPIWTRGDLVIPRELLEEIEAHALQEYPSESCGFVMGPASDPPTLDRYQREVNEADKYHALDPEHFPRTSSTYFKINELRAAKAFAKGEQEGQPIKVIYHSHCDAGAYFSQEDAATFASDGTLMWPCAFLVVSVQRPNGPESQPAVVDRKLWVHVPGTNDFAESELRIR